MSSAAYARTVHGHGPGLLLAHGAGGGVAANFGPILDDLAAARTVVAIDYPGTGDTPKATAPLSLDDLADQLVAAGLAEGLDTFAIAGYSLGAAVAARAATRHPDRVTALVLTAPFAHPDAPFRAVAERWRDLCLAGDHDGVARHIVPLALGPAVPDLEAVIADTARTLPPGSADHADLVARVDVRADLAALSVPTLVISTTDDGLVPPHFHREAAALSGAELAALDTGHLPFAQRPEEWRNLITSFLSQAAPAAAG
ncbi:alpha/beta fold hydrolase [Actinomadura bangladeshensis]|uniref:Alpha/beta fold hydrolase n=1 Tax=Actinomadura bangladeshensis TaxID=453573 RepID=A0A4R4P4Z7_9ACTN|nr:alpha/beta fold hydrolase [Actinomadura bangladeshensis]TDC16999.1 alpha/beta fold hydrolase [Actinomadura bangladeshensis]